MQFVNNYNTQNKILDGLHTHGKCTQLILNYFG